MENLKVSDTITLLPGQDDTKINIKTQKEKEQFSRFFSNDDQLNIFLALPIPDSKRYELLKHLSEK